MSDYIREQYNNPDEIYFLTLVTRSRIPFFIEPTYRQFAVDQLVELAEMNSGNLIAWVIMPDHIHFLLRQGRITFSSLISTFKRRTNLHVLNRHGTLWQPRFWEHRIRNEMDMKRHLDYIHFNPVEAELVERPEQYEASSFRLWVQRGEYAESWSLATSPTIPWDGGNPL